MTTTVDIDLGAYKLGWHDSEDDYVFKPRRGLSEDIIREMSAMKGEPEWMLAFRLKAYKRFLRKPVPKWGGGGKLDDIDFDDIYYYVKPTDGQAKDWDMVPESIKETYEKLGIPEAERKYLAGVTAQYECLRGDVRVYTANRGVVPIAEMVPGDEVYSYDERIQRLITAKVRAAAQTDVRQTYRVEVAGDRLTHATDNHPLLTEDGWKAVSDCRVGDRIAVAAALPEAQRVLALAAAVHSTSRVEDLPIGRTDSGVVEYAPIVSIEPADVAPVYDIEVDGPHNFVAEGIIVHNSEVVYHRNREDLEAMGVLFCDTDTAVRDYPEIVQQHFGTIIPPNDNKFAALNSAVWSGGSFIYVPPGVHVDQPLQAYFRINAENMGQFERTLIIVDEGSSVDYVEGCSAPVYSTDSLHSAVVEIVVKEGARCRYTTIQNWSPNVYNLVTKRAAAYRNATMEWIDANIGCLAEESTVTTPAGVKPIEELVPGEEVLSFDEALGEFAFRRVTAKRFSGLQPVREVRSGVRSLRVTENHPFYSEIDGTRCYVRADRLDAAAVPARVRQPALVGADGAGEFFEELSETVEIRKVEVSEPLEVVPTWDIEVEGTGNFVSEGFIVHNSRLTMKYPAVWLMEPGAHGEVLSMAYAGEGQHQDAGAKMVHAAPGTTSLITSKSISKDGGRGGYRGLVRVEPGAEDVKSFVRCDALILDEDSRSDTYPYMEIEEADARIGHEASVSKVGDDQLFYLMSRGLTEEEATAMIVAGFIEPVVKVLPMEYAVELNRLVELQMVGAVG